MWAQESSAWQSVAEMGRNNQHWQTRLELMRQMTLWSVEYGIDPPDWRHPDYSQVVSRKATAAEVRKWVDEFDDRFKRLHALLNRSGGLGAVVQECEDHVRNLDADGVRLRQSEWRRLCVQQCRLWRIVQEWFSDDPHFRDRPPNDCEMSLLRETERIRRRLEIRKATLRLRVAWPD
jgi:hypothetical protein